MSAQAQSTVESTSNNTQINETAPSMADWYFEGDAKRFMDRNPHQTSTFIHPSCKGDTFECYSNAHDEDPSNGHSTIHNVVIKAFQSSLASYAKETGPCKTQEELTAACRAMAGFHNSRHKRTKIWVSQPDASDGSVVSTGVTVADSLPNWVTHWPVYKVPIYQGQSKPDTQK